MSADKAYRTTGCYGTYTFNSPPICSQGIYETPDRIADPKELEAILTQERDCDAKQKYVRWNPSLSAREHIEMISQEVTYALQEKVAEIQRQQLILQERIEANTHTRHWTTIIVNFFLALMAASTALLGAVAMKYWFGFDVTP